MRALAVLILASLIVQPVAAAMSKAERQKLEAEIKALDKDKVHDLVAMVEEDPLGEAASVIRPALVVYFEDIPYDVCLDQLGPVAGSKKKWHEAIFWQVVFSSGDYFIHHPAGDREAYMLAGLEGGLRVYERV